MASQSGISSIALALSGKTASMDIPQPRIGFRPQQQNATRPGVSAMLPTPPNSISPTLSPQAAFKHHHQQHQQQHHDHLPVTPPLAPVDSDFDLRDDDEDNTSLALDGEITPAMLAKHHLPEILLQQGPLAIRHIMGCLTTSVPGFSRIPPNRARKLVVAALETNGRDVIFDKVGWGRWDAHRPRGDDSSSPSSDPSSSYQHQQQQGVQIPGASSRANKNSQNNNNNMNSNPVAGSMASDSAFFSHSEMDYGPSVLEHEADKMSLDGEDDGDGDDELLSTSEAPDDDIRDEDWEEGDVTDEEDWAQIGAAGLRARSLNAMNSFMNSSSLDPQAKAQLCAGGGPATSSLAKSAPRTTVGFHGVVDDNEERAAVEALLRLGSM